MLIFINLTYFLNNMFKKKTIAIIIPAYKVKSKLPVVLNKIPKFVDLVIVVDDFCPENSTNISFPKNLTYKIVKHKKNLGVGGAVKSGFEFVCRENKKIDIVVKIDGDDQMDLNYLPSILENLISLNIDFIKGNRFYNLSSLKKMPLIRIFGNAVLSFITKFSSGYYDIFDPTNGYFALNVHTLKDLEYHKLNDRYFFESDLLYRLNLINAKVKDYPINSRYSDEKSNLKIYKIIIPFLYFNSKNYFKRIIYKYFIRDFSVGSVQLFFGLFFTFLGSIKGSIVWLEAFNTKIDAPIGSIVLSLLFILIGFQLLLSFLNFDISNNPNNN